jgi:cytidine deaminase
MKKRNIGITVEVYDSAADLPDNDRHLLEIAEDITHSAYTPYSHFKVGAAVRLGSGEIVSGNNQENVAYPSGICAERVAIYYAGAHYPGEEVEAIAIFARSDEFIVHEVSPCGACRQAMSEYQQKQKKPIRVIMKGDKGEIQAVNSIEDLLPLMFHAEELKKKK